MADDLQLRSGPTGTDDSASGLRVFLLGSMQLDFNGHHIHIAGPQRRRLLALLACRAGRVVSVEALIDAMWGDAPPPSAAKTVQSHVVRLRQSLAVAGDPIETTPGGYRLDIDPAQTDIAVFERLANEGAAELRLGHAAAARKVLEAAIALWRGPALMEFTDDDFARGHRTRLEERRLLTIEDLAEARLAIGAAPLVVADMERVAAEQPGRERAWALLMRALYASGRQHEALSAYQRARSALAEEFGLDPGPELRDLEQRIIDQDPTLAGSRGLAVLPAALRNDTPFAGREHEMAWLHAAWRRACSGVGQVRVVRGPVASGRTRLVAEMAARAIAEGGSVEYVPGTTGLHVFAGGTGPGSVIDAVSERSRIAPLMLVIDDVDWTPPASIESMRAVATAAERLTVLVVLIGSDIDAPGTQLLRELERSCAVALDLSRMSDRELAQMLAGEGIDDDAVAAALVLADGLPGAARREAAAWAERAATDRLNEAATRSIGAQSAAAIAGASVFDEVMRLVEARARRAALVGAEWSGRQPYRSLASYGPADADLFVGRERLVAELTARVLDRRLVAVVGASGSGKSSLVRAGLIPLVRSGRMPGGAGWRAELIVPGDDPSAAIDSVPHIDEPGPQLLVIDQFEEVVATGQLDVVASRLLDLMLDPALDARIVLVVRADQIGALAASRTLAEMIEDSQVLVGPPTDDELRRIVTEPARRTGCTVESELVSTIMADVAGHDAALPLVSAALAEVWERRDGELLRASDYVAIGGLAAAVERLGDRALAAVETSGVDSIRDVMLRLVDVTDEGAWVRRRVASAELPQAARPAIDALLDARLVVHTGDTLDVVHEVVFRAWPQMGVWLEEARVDIALERDLRSSARTWDANGRSDDDVLRGTRLALATDWSLRSDHVPPLVDELISASRDWAERDNIAVRRQLERERRTARRMRGALVAASLLLVIALIGGGLALRNSRRAQTAENNAVDERNHARIDRLVAESGRVVNGQLDLAYLLAVEARRRDDTAATRGALLTTVVQTLPRTAATTPLARFGGYMNAVAVGSTPDPGNRRDLVSLSGDGAVLAVVGVYSLKFAQLVVSDVATREVLGHVDIPEYAESVDISPDGRTVVVLSFSGDPTVATLTVFDVPTGESHRLRVGADGLKTWEERWSLVRSSPDGGTVVVLLPDGSATTWNVHDGTQTGDVPGGPYQIIDVLPDGAFAGLTYDGVANFVDLTTSAVIGTTRLQLPDEVLPLQWDTLVSFAPDRSRILGAQWQGGVFLFDAKTGEMLGDPANRPDGARWVIPVPAEPNLAAIGMYDGDVVLWDVNQDVEVSRMKVHGSGVRDMTISADGSSMAVTADDRLISLWGDVGGPPPVDRHVTGNPGLELFPMATEMVSPDHRLIAVVGDGWHEVRDAASPNAPGVVMRDPAPWTLWAFDADGGRLLAQQDMHGSPLVVYDTSNGSPIWTQPDYDRADQAWGWSSLSPDGTLIAFEQNPLIRLWNIETDEEMASLDLHSLGLDVGTSTQMMFTDDGKYLDVPSQSGPIRFTVPDLELVNYIPAGRPQFKAVRLPNGDIDAMNGPGRVSRYDMESGTIVATGRNQDVTTIGPLTISPDRSIVAGVRPASRAVSLFDAETAQPIGSPIPGDGNGDVVFADNQLRVGLGTSYLIAYGVDGRPTAWDIDPDHWQSLACHAAGRNLTREEWDRYMGSSEPYHPTCPEWPSAA